MVNKPIMFLGNKTKHFSFIGQLQVLTTRLFMSFVGKMNV